MRQIPPLAAVRVFEAAARHLNFTAAAAELNMTQAAVSYQVKLIEDRLGAALFVRSRRGVALTPLGQRAAPLVSSAFEMLDDAFAEVREESSTVLSITTLPSFAAGWLAPRIGAFQLAHPEIAVRFDSSNQMLDLASSGYDAAVRTGRGDWPGMRSRFLARVHFTPMCSPAFIERHKITRPEDLLRVPRLSSDIDWWPLWIAAAGLDASRLEARQRTMMDTQANEAAAAMAGHGVALLTPLLWSRHLASGELVQPFETMAYHGTSYWLTVPERRDRTAKIRLFRDWLTADIAAARTEATADAFVAPPAG
jgi:LysR family glycine cleavage system transcriptional activator